MYLCWYANTEEPLGSAGWMAEQTPTHGQAWTACWDCRGLTLWTGKMLWYGAITKKVEQNVAYRFQCQRQRIDFNTTRISRSQHRRSRARGETRIRIRKARGHLKHISLQKSQVSFLNSSTFFCFPSWSVLIPASVTSAPSSDLPANPIGAAKRTKIYNHSPPTQNTITSQPL